MWRLTRLLALSVVLVMLSASAAVAQVNESPEPWADPAPPGFGETLPGQGHVHVPQFVGPATLKLTGGVGTWRWQRVRYGSDKVHVRIAMVGDEVPCRLRLGIADKAEVVADLWFESATPEKKEEHEAIIEVDYADGRLAVDSDCPRWSLRLRPLVDPELSYSLEEDFYPVRGDTLDELIAGTAHVEGKWAAYAGWFTNWTYTPEEVEAECRIAEGRATLAATITYPDWKRRRDADPRLVARWDAFMEALRVHEQGHVTIGLQGAAAIDDQLDAGPTAATCDEVEASVNAAATDTLKRSDRRTARYDRDTAHGATQGAILD